MARLVVFDIDGTLVQRHPKENDAAYMKAAQEILGIQPPKGWDDFVTSTDSGVLHEMTRAQLGRACTHDEQLRVRESMVKWLGHVYADSPFVATPGALEAWAALREDPSYTVAIATGNWEFAGRYKLASAGFSLEAEPFGSADDGIHRTDVLATALKRALELNPGQAFERVIYVGDWIWDVRAARTLGWDFIGVAGSYINDPEGVLRKAGATNLIEDFEGLFEALRKIEN